LTLSADYLREAEYRARRFQGAFTGTSGTLAADSLRLLTERKTLMSTIAELEEQNAALRNAVEARLAGNDDDAVEPTSIDDPGEAAIPVDWILQGERQLLQGEPRQTGDGVMNAPAARLYQEEPEAQNAAERLLMDAIAVIRDRRPLYGGPRQHFRRTVGMINAAFRDVLNRPLTESDWALIMTLDKVARFLGPTKTSDQITDLAGYAACLAECEAP
jgi:hypothetical protein